MKRQIIYTVITAIVLPSLLIGTALRLINREVKKEDGITGPEMNTEQSEQKHNTVLVATSNGVSKMELEEYIISVLLGEMPQDFELEALKAQAVVARTYTQNRKGNRKHTLSDVCTDSSCCQAYMSQEAYINAEGSAQFLERVKQAVLETKGQVLMYQGKVIEATYFSCSGGKTEDAKAVWGSDIPYLRSVESPGEEMAQYYTDTIHLSLSEFREKLNIDNAPVGIENIRYTNGGGVQEITVNGKVFSGTEIRKCLQLRSTAFVITVMGDSVTITTKGFGHRVGMSQYGAEAMALQGKTYQEILSHYYVGTELLQLDFG